MTPDNLLDLIGIDISPARLKCALLSLDTVAHALADEAAGNAEADGSAPAPATASDSAQG
jgi:NifU-like protein involved in Fe-S cluster formation